MIPLMNMEQSRDIELLQLIARRDEEALERLYDCYSGLLFGVIFRVVAIREEAENILQEVFLQVWNKAGSYNPLLGTPIVWLIRIARNKSIDYWRSKPARMRAREADVEEIHDAKNGQGSLDPMESLSSSQLTELVTGALNRLPDSQRKLIELAYYEGYSQSELAEKFSVPLGTVKSRMRAGMLALREQLLNIPELYH
ncbi:MAG: sigma-70 family RNA polymerase sigma factor [Bacteroidetes bacterium]|nr:MAG: sigma-70 family RNA polymerase sigma factor [Bacteroidota bacterium]